MNEPFSRVKSIINRLREVLKCQQCLEMKKEEFMLFYHVCDHFYCIDCISDPKETCPLCKNPLDKPINVESDKNILSLYQSLAKFELPSKQDIEKIFKGHKAAKERKSDEKEDKLTDKISKQKLSEDQSTNNENEIQETPKNQTKKRPSLRKKSTKNNSSGEIVETIILSSAENESENTPKGVININETVQSSKKDKKNSTPARKGKSAAVTTTPAGRIRNTTPLTTSAGSSKGNTSASKSNVNKRNHKGETPLHLACKKSNFSAMADLIAAGANPNAQDNAGWTPLHDSVFSGNVEVIKFLLDNGAKVNTPGLENTTALHEAIAKGNVKIVRLLLEYGADLNALNIFKETPLDLVTKYKLEEMKEVLSEAKNLKKTSETSDTLEVDRKLIIYKYNLPIEDEKLVNKFVEEFEGETVPSLGLRDFPSHIVIPHEKIQMTWALISSVPKGCWIMTVNWVKDSLKESMVKSEKDYEPDSPLFSGFPKARTNLLNQLPALFSGCHFYFGGNFEHYTFKNLTIGKEDLKTFVEKNGGIILKRCPDPESLALEKTIPFHAPESSSLRETSYFIIYFAEKWDPKPKYNMSHMKTLSVEWLICCILKFELIDPNDKTSSWSDLL